jgi:superoxide reductase
MQKPEAEFCVTAKKLSARDYCNIHGLWKSK